MYNTVYRRVSNLWYSRVCNSISYLTHHMRQISGAAVMTDAANIEKEIIKLKITHASRAQ